LIFSKAINKFISVSVSIAHFSFSIVCKVKNATTVSSRTATHKDLCSRILKVNSSWSSTWAKICQLIACLSVVLLQLNLTKLKLEYLKFGF